MRKSQIAFEEVLEQFMLRLEAALRLAPVGSAADPSLRAQHFKKALQSSGITHAVAADVLDVPADWWWCEELKVWLPPVEKLPPMEALCWCGA